MLTYAKMGFLASELCKCGVVDVSIYEILYISLFRQISAEKAQNGLLRIDKADDTEALAK